MTDTKFEGWIVHNWQMTGGVIFSLNLLCPLIQPEDCRRLVGLIFTGLSRVTFSNFVSDSAIKEFSLQPSKEGRILHRFVFDDESYIEIESAALSNIEWNP